MMYTSIHLGVALAQLEAQGAARSQGPGGLRGRGGREQDGPSLPAERINLTAGAIGFIATTSTLGLWKRSVH